MNEQQAARERLALPKVVPDAGEPAYVRRGRPKKPRAEAAAAAAEPLPNRRRAEAPVEDEPRQKPASEAAPEHVRGSDV